jgi:hypothetical protein
LSDEKDDGGGDDKDDGDCDGVGDGGVDKGARASLHTASCTLSSPS